MLKISLAAARVNANMTQTDVAKELHVSSKTVGNWETGKIEPSTAVIMALSQLYKIPIKNLLLPSKFAKSERALEGETA